MVLLNQLATPLSPYFAQYTANLWGFFLFGIYLAYCVVTTMRWVQSYRIGKGHYISGIIACTLNWMYVPVLFTAPTNPYWMENLAWLPMLGSCIKEGYNVAYFYDWKQYDAWLDEQDSAVRKAAPISRPTGRFWQDTTVGDFLSQPQPEKTGLFMRHYKTALAAAALLFMSAFGFWRSTENLAAGANIASKNTEQVVAKQVSQSEKKLARTITSTAANVTATSTRNRDTLLAGQQQQQKKQNELAGQVTEVSKRAAIADRKADRAEDKAERFRNSPVLIVQPSATPPVGGKQAQPNVPAKLRGRKTGMNDSGDSQADVELARYGGNEYDDENN